MFTLGLIINPLAGIGGPLALKGSDGAAIVAEAHSRGTSLRAPQRAIEALQVIAAISEINVVGFAGPMGADIAQAVGLPFETIGAASSPSSAADTIAAAKALTKQGVDLILFAGGDGTARDIFEAVGTNYPVLGIPAGVKMHSGVYAVSPQAAGEIVKLLITGQLVDIGLAEVRDIDEERFRQGVVSSRFYGELLVPRQGRFLQQVKSSGREVEELVLQDIAADIIESMEDDCLYLIGPGTTPGAVTQELGLANTLLGFDAVLNRQLVAADLDEHTMFQLVQQHQPAVKVLITATGGQGHIIGRGNQQLSPRIIRAIGLDNLIILATKTKITELQGRPLQVDSNDAELDRALSGYRQVITGYHDAVIYPVGLFVEQPE